MTTGTLDNVAGGVRRQVSPPGHDTKSLGPNDSSDSGSDIAGPGLIEGDQLGLDRGTNEAVEAGARYISNAGASVGDLGMDENSDRFGTGERSAAGKEPSVGLNSDYGFDRIVDAREAGLGSGLDQAEEARLGITDEEIEDNDENA